MAGTTLTKQLILDAAGKPIGVILPIEEYQALMRAQKGDASAGCKPIQASLYGILRSLGGCVASTESLDRARRALWPVWDQGDNPYASDHPS